MLTNILVGKVFPIVYQVDVLSGRQNGWLIVSKLNKGKNKTLVYILRGKNWWR